MENIILFLLLILIVLIYFKNTNEKFITNEKSIDELYTSYYDTKFINKSKYNYILLLGFIKDSTLNYFKNKFPDATIYIYNEKNIEYPSLSDTPNSKIHIYNTYPYDLTVINNFKNNNILFDIIICEGFISNDNLKFILEYYYGMLKTDEGNIIIKNINNISDVDTIIKSVNPLFTNIKEIKDFTDIISNLDTNTDPDTNNILLFI